MESYFVYLLLALPVIAFVIAYFDDIVAHFKDLVTPPEISQGSWFTNVEIVDVWFSDGTNYPVSFNRGAFPLSDTATIHKHFNGLLPADLPHEWLFVEYVVDDNYSARQYWDLK